MYGWKECVFCGKKLNGYYKYQNHQQEVHKADIAPGVMFQDYNMFRESAELWNSHLVKHDMLTAFLDDEAALAYPIVREMVEKEMRHEQSRQWLLSVIADDARNASIYRAEWLRWVREENTYGIEELLRLVKAWNSHRFRATDEEELRAVMMQYA